MTRRTKILATLGPSTDDPAVLRRILTAGVDVVRLNYSHGRAEDHARRAAAVRKTAMELGLDIGILADLQGPKIRIESWSKASRSRWTPRSAPMPATSTSSAAPTPSCRAT